MFKKWDTRVSLDWAKNDERRQKTIEQMKKSKPLSLDQAKRAAAEGKM